MIITGGFFFQVVFVFVCLHVDFVLFVFDFFFTTEIERKASVLGKTSQLYPQPSLIILF